jgi:signal transduction histidine kinase
LERRLAAAVVVSVLAVVVSAVRPIVDLVHWPSVQTVITPQADDLDLRDLKGEDGLSSSIGDLAPVLAREWGLDDVPRGAEVLVFDSEGNVVSSWGDLGPAGERVKVAADWTTGVEGVALVQLRLAEEPWSLLGDWPTRGGLDSSRRRSMWWVVLTRSGTVAASLHPDVAPLSPSRAGDLYYRRGGWTWMDIGGSRYPARIIRNRSWLVARVAHVPSVATWLVRALLAVLWVLAAMALARPPVWWHEGTATFGGRLRLLVAGAVIVPLVALALVLQFRISGQEAETERTLGLDSFRAVRYTAEHLGGDFEIDNDFARWLAKGWGGEVVLFDGIDAVAASRPDLVDGGHLPGLPLADVFPLFLLGRDDVVVRRWGHEMVVAGSVVLNRRRILLELFKEGPFGDRDMPRAIDWLFGGAVVAALLALVLAGRIERRLSHSLRDLVGVSRRLLDGEPLGSVARPRERDLAEVLDAVERMSHEVQEREASLKDQEEMLRITLANLEPAVLVCDAEDRVIFANPTGNSLIRDFPDVLGDRGRIKKVVAGTDQEILRPDPGKDLSWRVGSADVPLPGGRRGRVLVIEDVTEVVRADRLQQLTHMARIVAHEVKNPLTPIRLWIQELQEQRRRGSEDLGELVDQAATEILVQAGRLQETANAFSNLVALERWEPELIDLSEIVKEAVGHLDILHRLGATLRMEIADPGCCRIFGDGRWIRRAVDTLLLNSLTVIDHHTGEIIVRARREGASCILEVEDDGGGVKGENIDDLFAPHFSATGSGTGLGLALVRQVVVRAHGTVDAFNGVAGLVVRMRFPEGQTPRERPSGAQPSKG